MAPRLTVVTSGHPSSCPRMVKAADAAVDAGFDVRFVSVDYVNWAAELDGALVNSRRWRWQRVSLRRAGHPVRSRWVSARQRAARAVADALTPERAPRSVCVRGYARTHPELVAAILSEPFDLVYGGTVGALAATAEAAHEAGRPFGLDLEDYHLAELADADAALTHSLATRVVQDAARGAAFVTTASVPMAVAYEDTCAIEAAVIHNVVSRPLAPPTPDALRGPLSMYWFSQTVGAGRGLEDVVAAVACADVDAELHLRGTNGDVFVEHLRGEATRRRARLKIVLHPAAPADAMVALCRPYAIGLSLEQHQPLNRDLSVSNKILTYFAGGLAVVATDTRGHHSVAVQAPGAVRLFRHDRVEELARILREWNDNRDALATARQASWQAARDRFHWEHPLERDALVAALKAVA